MQHGQSINLCRRFTIPREITYDVQLKTVAIDPSPSSEEGMANLAPWWRRAQGRCALWMKAVEATHGILSSPLLFPAQWKAMLLKLPPLMDPQARSLAQYPLLKSDCTISRPSIIDLILFQSDTDQVDLHWMPSKVQQKGLWRGYLCIVSE